MSEKMPKISDSSESNETNSGLKPNVFYIRHGHPSGNWGAVENYRDFLRANEWIKTLEVPLDKDRINTITDSLKEAKIENENIKLILSSPYLRTKETSEIIQQYLKEKTDKAPRIRTTELLREIDFDTGIISEKEFYELRKQGFDVLWKKFDERWFSEKRGLHENISESYERARKLLSYLSKIRKFTKYDKIMIVSHGMFGRVLQHVIQGGKPENFFNETDFIKVAGIHGICHDPSTDNFQLVQPNKAE